MTMELVREGRNRYILRRQGKMRVEGIVYVNHQLLPLVMGDKSLQQLANAACLPGVADRVCGMPDIHEGFGLPVERHFRSGTNGKLKFP
ncbi:MAG: RtcB family protein [Desulfotomaculaceae bacterium]|nr:RtcB family protein [Desulfotomaculaceae bacterium]